MWRWVICLTTFLASICSATTIQVPADQPTIQAGIDAAAVGDTVLVADGTYSGVGNWNLDYGGKDIVLRSENGPFATTIHGQLQSYPNDGDNAIDGAEDVNNDGSIDGGETDPLDADTDDDGLADGDEPSYSLNPLLADSDGYGLSDGLERGAAFGIPPGMSGTYLIPYLGTALSFVPDGDGGATTTVASNPDTDGDLLNDGLEDTNLDGVVGATETDPNLSDTDADGLADGTEDANLNGSVDFGETDPLDPDSDNDTVIDGIDNCPLVPNVGQEDGNGNGVGDACENCCAGEQRGDANLSGGTPDLPTIGDISAMIDAKFISSTCGPKPGETEDIIACIDEADVNASAAGEPTCDDITIGDISLLVDYLFITGPAVWDDSKGDDFNGYFGTGEGKLRPCP